MLVRGCIRDTVILPYFGCWMPYRTHVGRISPWVQLEYNNNNNNNKKNKVIFRDSLISPYALLSQRTRFGAMQIHSNNMTMASLIEKEEAE